MTNFSVQPTNNDAILENGGGIRGDLGTYRRVFGSLITWMQEKTTPVFIVSTRAFSTSNNRKRRDFNRYDINHSISNTVPLANIASGQIEELKQWAAQAGARTASIDLALSEDLKKRSAKYGIGPIEVD